MGTEHSSYGSPLHCRSHRTARKPQGEGLVVPREQHLSLGARHEIHGETTGCELANVVPAEEKREVEKGEMLPAATWGAHHEAHDCECAHGDGALPWHEIRSQAGEPPALPSSSHLSPSPGWCLCLPHVWEKSVFVEETFKVDLPGKHPLSWLMLVCTGRS